MIRIQFKAGGPEQGLGGVGGGGEAPTEVTEKEKEQIRSEVEKEMASKGADLLTPESKRKLEEETESRAKEVARNLMAEQEMIRQESLRIEKEKEIAEQESESQKVR